MISIIAAMDDKRGIGKENRIPWHIKEDLVHLKSLTKDQIVILGRKTYESMDEYYAQSGREMPGKLYIVVTRDEEYEVKRQNAVIVHNLEEGISKAENESDVFLIGGGQIFKEAMEKDLVDRLYLTIVEGDYGADTFFPDYSMFDEVTGEESGQSGEYKYKFLELKKS